LNSNKSTESSIDVPKRKKVDITETKESDLKLKVMDISTEQTPSNSSPPSPLPSLLESLKKKK